VGLSVILKLNKKQVDIISTALFEYTEICFDQGTKQGKADYSESCCDKKAPSYKLAVAMGKVLDVINDQRNLYEKEKTKKLSNKA
jgi:hypothetical protein